MKILVINCGSSSLKYQLINMEDKGVLAQGLVERIGISGSILTQKVDGRDKYVIESPLKDHQEAIDLVLRTLVDDNQGVIKSMEEISAVGHRVVHGGEKYATSVVVTEEVIKNLEDFIKLAPLHNPPNIIGIRACQALMPNTPMVAVFDTAFHQTMPEKAFMYPLPYELYKEDHIRRYGFHGTSHKYVAGEVAKWMKKDIKDIKTITCHLGNGVSVTAVNGGQSIDTTMGFTPLDGIIMGSRSGSIDPAIVTYLVKEKGYSIDEVNEILNKKSGVLGISGLGTDFRDIRAAVEERNDKRALLTMDIYGYQIKKQIGAYAAAMAGVDAIVFTAGIGEHAPEIRVRALTDMEFLGIELDVDKNDNQNIGDGMEISKPSSKVKVFVIPTNEELMIAEETLELIQK
ncbi:acetate kinase [Clostridium saccharobutylicum]|uniref:Acetate kinase n=1 Tax=Clostridium saccharobutylicum DSM 13864 TaxID=1345695 RepID=U5MNQ1_CLOSA|nr:acetate kinase [Clostridium saccharobutylicum]AGX42389.1 acetate kinase AckA [Clostridium saccharobutylicum DSM 13864]AQR89670.1 acetate kinase [Clostridium saccharobutylicum]AQR99572.1 acetate kinase [Clostridium saccharobutylicum]AQS09302.1 acetate kinase [Clostridium saccharobutylicum]AQS13558.1 acetate kinase [Clostridium saccharobutylicum]